MSSSMASLDLSRPHFRLNPTLSSCRRESQTRLARFCRSTGTGSGENSFQRGSGNLLPGFANTGPPVVDGIKPHRARGSARVPLNIQLRQCCATASGMVVSVF